MAYSIWQDMEEVNQNPDKWINHGRSVLENSCKHRTQDESKEETNIRYSGYCSECEVYEDSAYPMMNYFYPLELKNFDDSKILQIVKETNCTVLENEETGEWFLSLCGGGMDLSQDIALAYVILERWIPQDLLNNVAKQPCLSLGEKNYKKLAKEVIKQLKVNSDNFKRKRQEWKESLKSLKNSQKAKLQPKTE
jgi:hypothetical protein